MTKTFPLKIAIISYVNLFALSACYMAPLPGGPPPPPSYVYGPPPAQPQPPPPVEVEVGSPPPLAIVEPIPVSPGPAYVWIGGAWIWHGRWVWEHGRWDHPPHPGAVWVPHHYAYHNGRHVFVHGGWR